MMGFEQKTYCGSKQNKKARHHSGRRGYFRNHPPEVHFEVNQLFDKKFSYSKCTSWVLVDSSQMFETPSWQVSKLQDLKQKLNKVKDTLSDKEINVWHVHTEKTNKAGSVIHHLRSFINPELCTQAWTKFYEILGTFPLIPGSDEKFNSVHLCEAPGAFIASINHYIKSRRIPIHWTWLATTLNPYYEGNDPFVMIDDDRFIVTTLKSWYFGMDNTGDVTKLSNLHGLLEEVHKKLDVVHLVTADGSFNCQNNPAAQEQITAPLYYCEMVSAFHILSPGGSFILKMFTLFEHTSVCTLYVLNCLFHEVTVFKPATSKSGNSEVYVICQGYCGKSKFPSVLQKLLQEYDSASHVFSNAMLSLADIPDSFLEQHVECCSFFTSCQIETIETNKDLWENSTESAWRHLKDVKELALQTYCERFQVRAIADSEKISAAKQTKNSLVTKSYASQGGRKLRGSFMERLKSPKSHSWCDKAFEILERCQMPCGYYWQSLKAPVEEASLQPNDLDVVVGRKMTTVLSTKFCNPNVVEIFNEALCDDKLMCKLREATNQTSAWVPSFVQFLVSQLTVSSASRINCLAEIDTGCTFASQVIKCLSDVVPQKVIFNTLTGKSLDKSLSEQVGFSVNSGYVSDTQEKNGLLNVQVEKTCLKSAANPQYAHSVSPLPVDESCDKLDSGDNRSSDSTAWIHIADVTGSSQQDIGYGREELAVSSTLISVCLDSLKILPKGGTLVILMFDCLTRVSIGMLFILYKLFKQVGMYKPSGSLQSCSRVLVCTEFRGCESNILYHLQCALDAANNVSPEQQLLQVTGISCLFEKHFHHFICQTNDEILSNRLLELAKMADL